ncbi:nucleoside phosphorylase domain-containing protein [Cyathus striatus]|nr:nucleoside phosphorylase domain-containing protein [Cyathus striatus]
MADQKVLIGVIGGSELYHLDNLTFMYCTLIAFLARYGTGHTITPSHVPACANIAALNSIGVHAIIAFSTVSSLHEEICPGDFTLPSQIIDCTKGIRPSTYFNGSIIVHAMFGDPFSGKFVVWLEERTIVCMEGLQFSMMTESVMYRLLGGDLINMSVLPRARLAREAELSYTLIATATDYNSWCPASSVTATKVFKTLKATADTLCLAAATVFGDLYKAISGAFILLFVCRAVCSSLSLLSTLLNFSFPTCHS